MNRAAILDRSEKLERHIALVEEDLTRQRELVVELMREGEDATGAMALLRQFEELQTRLFADRDVLRRHLEAAGR
jgi:Fe2+ or Zn2+ uptake regulation protein